MQSSSEYVAESGATRRRSIMLGQRNSLEQRTLELAVSRVFDIDSEAFHSGSRGSARVASARQAAMYLAHVSCGLSLTAVGQLFGRDRTTVAYACAVTEDRRDNLIFDRAMLLIEWSLPMMIERERTLNSERRGR